MLIPCTRPYLPVKDLLSSADQETNVSYQTPSTSLAKLTQNEKDDRLIESQQKECYEVVAKGGIKIVNRTVLLKETNFVARQYVLTVKNLYEAENFYNDRWILLGHHDKFLHLIANDFPLLLRTSLKIILSLAVTKFSSRIWLVVFGQAFML